MTEYKALKGRILVQILGNKNRTASGLHLVDKSLPSSAKVLSVGDAVGGVKPPCKVGEVVIFKKYGATSLNGKEGRKSQEAGFACVYFNQVIGVE